MEALTPIEKAKKQLIHILIQKKKIDHFPDAVALFALPPLSRCCAVRSRGLVFGVTIRLILLFVSSSVGHVGRPFCHLSPSNSVLQAMDGFCAMRSLIFCSASRPRPRPNRGCVRPVGPPAGYRPFSSRCVHGGRDLFSRGCCCCYCYCISCGGTCIALFLGRLPASTATLAL